MTGLQRRLGAFDVTMIVMGGIVGAGIFINPSVVARMVHSPALIVGVWAIGGLIALGGAFIWAELATIRPDAGGQYVYLRDAFHPMVAFLYGWTLLLVVQSGGMAAVAVTFAHYAGELTGAAVDPRVLATVTLALLSAVNCLGVRTGSNVQSALMVTKIVVVAALIACGLLLVDAPAAGTGDWLDRPPSFGLLAAIGGAMVPVLFACGGWQTASFVAGEVQNPTRNMPAGLIVGVTGVVLLYLGVNLVSVRALGPDGLAATLTPASAVMDKALGPTGRTLIAMGIAISALGFLSQGILSAPRVYFAMARDGLFFERVGWVHPRTGVPVVSILLQGIVASVIAMSGRYEQILSYVVAMDWVFFGLTAASLFVFRSRPGEAARADRPALSTPAHPWSTALFVVVCATIVASTVLQFPGQAGIGFAILAAGVPAYYLWRRRP